MNMHSKLKIRLPGRWLVTLWLGAAAASASSQSPWVSTQAAGPVGPAVATLNGMATARGQDTAAWFEWGSDRNYGASTAPATIGSSSKVARVSTSIDGLAAGATYHYRLVATNASGATLGADQSFCTGTKVATWTDLSVPYPAIPSGLSNIVGQACGHGHSLAITAEGKVVAWRISSVYNDAGQATVPKGLSNVVAVAGGWEHSLALGQDGTVCAWGYNFYGQTNVPTGLTNAVAIAAGDYHSLALKSDGTVTAWGYSAFGQATNVPKGLSNVVAIASGSSHCVALRDNGTLAVWGTEPSAWAQTPPTGLSNVVAIASETWHNLALRADGTVIAWGDNSYGQTNVPVGLSNVVAIAAGFNHSLALKADSTLLAWGMNRYVTNVPALLSNVVAISSGDYHSVALGPTNLAPLAYNRSVVGLPDTDLVITLTGWDPNGDALSFRINSLPLSGALYQYNGSGRGDPISNPDTPLSDPTRVVFSPPPQAVGVALATFGITASDGQLGSPPSLATVTILPPPQIQSSTFTQTGTQGFTLSFGGLTNASYSVQTSTNLTKWTRLGSASQSSPGQFFYLDTGVTNKPNRFYRVTSP
jgi:alpha-tubulin suppressor-like RCC1 family protein